MVSFLCQAQLTNDVTYFASMIYLITDDVNMKLFIPNTYYISFMIEEAVLQHKPSRNIKLVAVKPLGRYINVYFHKCSFFLAQG